MITSMLVRAENVVDDASRLGCRNGVDLEVAGVVISALESAQPRPGPDSYDRLTADHDSHGDRLVNTTLGVTRASRLSAAVSVLVSFATIQPGSCWIAMPVVAAWRCGLSVDGRPKATGKRAPTSLDASTQAGH
jgi:hypothetical protein